MGGCKNINYSIENIILKLVFVTFCLILICQSLIYFRPFNLRLSLVDKLEGEPIRLEAVYPAGELQLEVNNVLLEVKNSYISSLPEAKIFLNDKLIGDFTNLQFTVIVEIGDIITIDTSKYSLDLLINLTPSEGINISQNSLNVKKGEKVSIVVKKESKLQ